MSLLSSRKIVGLLVVIFVLLFLASLFLFIDAGHSERNGPGHGRLADVFFGNSVVRAEIADTPELRSRGLMFREHLNDAEGMLFVFDYEGRWSFWMKNTLIPLDIIWIDNNFRIIHIEKAVPCVEETCVSYSPSAPARYVVEVNHGYTERNGVGIGDPVSIVFD